MKPLSALLLLAALITSAAVASADPADPAAGGVPLADPAVGGVPPAVGNSGFLTALQNAGITYDDPARVIAAAQAVCGLIDNGKPGLEILQGLMNTNPGFTMDGAAQFAAIAANAYCPHQLIAGLSTT